MNPKYVHQLNSLNACSGAAKWFAKQETPTQAWRDCTRPDWLLWIAGRLSGKPGSKARRRLVICACECARLALPYATAGEMRPLKAIETAEAWARGKAGVTLEQVRHAAYAAYAAADAAYAAANAAPNTPLIHPSHSFPQVASPGRRRLRVPLRRWPGGVGQDDWACLK